jgi:hypothetical protein
LAAAWAKKRQHTNEFVFARQAESKRVL